MAGELVSLELCAGGGGTALGLEQAGFTPGALVEIDADCCRTLCANRPGWLTGQGSIENVRLAAEGEQVDLLSAGLPCTPHSRGGRQLGEADERHLWAGALRIIAETRPRAVLLETADAILKPRFAAERAVTLARLDTLGYETEWRVLDASQYGVPQRRKRAVLVALREREAVAAFCWPEPSPGPPLTAGNVLHNLAAARGWAGADAWRDGAQDVAPTLSAGSTKHGGPDWGPTQTKRAFRRLGIDASGVPEEPPGPDGKFLRGYKGRVALVNDAGETGLMLTVAMAARLQGFPPGWAFCGGKTSQARQVGNAFPPPVARAVGEAIRMALELPGTSRCC